MSMARAPAGASPATALAGPTSLIRSPSTRIAWLVRVVPARGSTRRPALMTTVTDGTAAAAGATGACAVSGTTAAASALRAAAGRTLLVMTTSEETTKEWRLGELCTSREIGGGGVERGHMTGARWGGS